MAHKAKVFPVFVDNIDYDVNTKDLREVFQRYGRVAEVTILSQHGFVAFSDPNDAMNAIHGLKHYILRGRKIRVEVTEELDAYLKQKRRYIEEQHLRRKSMDQHDRYDRSYRSKHRSRSEEQRWPMKRKITIQRSKGDLRQMLNKRSKVTTDDNASDISEVSEASKTSKMSVASKASKASKTSRASRASKASRSSRGFRNSKTARRYRGSSRDSRHQREASRDSSRNSRRHRDKSRDTSRDSRASKASRDSRASKTSKAYRDSSRESRASKEAKVSKPTKPYKRYRDSSRESEKSKDSRDSRDSRVSKSSKNSRASRTSKSSRASRRSKASRDSRGSQRSKTYAPSRASSKVSNKTKNSEITRVSSRVSETTRASRISDCFRPPAKVPHGMQEIYIGYLVSQVEKSDLEHLFSTYGPVKSVKIEGDHAYVRIACDAATAQDAVETLDGCEWMDNHIHVKFSVRTDIIKKEIDKYEIWLWSDSMNKETFLEDMCDLLSDYGEVIDREWRQGLDSLSFEIKASEDQILDCVRHLNTFHQYKDGKIRAKFVDNSDAEARLSKEIEDYPFQLVPESFIPSVPSLPSTSLAKKTLPDKKIKVREIWLWTPAAFKKSFLKDMEIMVSPYGKVKNKGWRGDYIYLELESSEKRAVQCVAEVHGSSYKASTIRAKFADDTPEDELYKETAYSILLRKYEKVLIPESSSTSPTTAQAVNPNKISFEFNQKRKSPSPTSVFPTRRNTAPAIIEGPSHKIVYDSAILENVEGRVYSMSSKLILISFHVGNAGTSQRFARLKPGHMHINGRKNFGFLVKDSRYSDWPESIRDVFKLDQSVRMDLRQLSHPEKEEMRNLTHENVMYDVSLLWKGSKPADLIRKSNKPTLKATVLKLWTKWAILKPVMFNGEQNLILMLREEFYTPEDPDSNQSLLNHIEIGDTLAVLSTPTDYLVMAEKARSLDYFQGPTNNLKYQSILAWPLTSEIDPYAILGKQDKQETSEIEYFASAVNLNFSLPSEREATFKKLKGVIDEIHVPSGGVISLKDFEGNVQAEQKVYFHRSRLFVNGVKLASNAALEDEISVGDPVHVDITKNQFDLTSTYVSGTEAFWIGLSVKVSTVDRGQTIANKLRAEVSVALKLNQIFEFSSHFKTDFNNFYLFYSRQSTQMRTLRNCAKEE